MSSDPGLNTFDQKIEAGKCLTAKTDLQDPNFIMSVTFLCHHDEEGSFGLTLNRPTTLYIDPLNFNLSQTKDKEAFHPIYLGGPVQPDHLFYLFRHDEELPDSRIVMDDIQLSSNPETYKILEQKQTLTSSNIRFFLGYAGWSYFQLDCEASLGSWYVQPALTSYIFYPSEENLWLTALGDLGPDFHKMGEEFLNSI